MGQSQTEEGPGSGEVDPAIFDRVHLSQYTGGDAALERELVTLFLDHFAPVRRQLEAAQSAYDWKFASHSLKGSARSIGAPQLATLAERIEAIGFEAAESAKTQALDELEAAMAAFAAEVKKVAP